MDDILDLLQDVRKRPALYLGKTSLELLNAFIGGCICYHAKIYGTYTMFNTNFQDFIQNRFNIHTTQQGWWSIIRSFCKSDEDAFYKFFDLLDEFLETHKDND